MSASAAPMPAASPAATPARLPAALLMATAGLAAIAHAPGILDMAGRWFAPSSYYGHGPFIPLASAWLVWRERAALRETPLGSSPRLGLTVVGASMLLLVASLVLEVHVGQNAALVGTLGGAALVLLGRDVVRRIWPAFAILIFMVPLPTAIILRLTFELKMIAAHLSAASMTLAGVPAIQDGSVIHLETGSVIVDEVCSGLRTLVTLVAAAALFAATEPRRVVAVATLLLAVPIALAANVGRILLLCYLDAQGAAVAPGETLHEVTGLVVYALALAMLMLVRAVPIGGGDEAESEGEATAANAPAAIEAGAATDVAGPEPTTTASTPPRGARAGLIGVLGLGALAGLLFGFIFTAPAVGATELTRKIPARIGDWAGLEIALGPRVPEIMGTSDILYRRYTHPRTTLPVDLYVIHATDSRKVAHPPEICFTGGGFATVDRADRDLVLSDGAVIPAVRTLLSRDGTTFLVYHWYRLDGRDTASYVDHQITWLFRRLTRSQREGSMVRLSTPVAPGTAGASDAQERIDAFVREALALALEPIP